MKIKNIVIPAIISIILLSGCVKQQAFICFNNRPITEETVLNPVSEFNSGEKIYYLFFSKKPLENDYIRIQVFKQGDSIQRGGYEMVRVKDYRLMKDEFFYQTDYFILYEPGRYIMQIYNPQNLNIPLASGEFRIK